MPINPWLRLFLYCQKKTGNVLEWLRKQPFITLTGRIVTIYDTLTGNDSSTKRNDSRSLDQLPLSIEVTDNLQKTSLKGLRMWVLKQYSLI
ncbi:hypothetical protein [Paenibacillus sp. sgz5001063]|uniref:hypothetical protein n=1 Tax=Paenibacillus sp. sgz5001063 TaxID=3242474 RepID=UPI0036D27496